MIENLRFNSGNRELRIKNDEMLIKLTEYIYRHIHICVCIFVCVYVKKKVDYYQVHISLKQYFVTPVPYLPLLVLKTTVLMYISLTFYKILCDLVAIVT